MKEHLIRYECDHCRKEILALPGIEPEDWGVVCIGEWVNPKETYDLCPDCFAKYRNTVEEILSGEKDETIQSND
jgi:ribosomal protein L44E